MVQEGLCASLVVHRMNFGRRVDVNGKRFENEKLPQDKGDVKTEGVKGNNFNRKRSPNKSVKQQKTRKMVPSKNGVKRMRCGEKRMSREACHKKKRCPKIRMPRERDVNGKRLKRHRFQETAVTSEKACQDKRVCQVSGSRAVHKKGCQDSEASRIKRKWQHQTKMSRARNAKDKDFQEITPSTAVPARGSGAVPIGSPLFL